MSTKAYQIMPGRCKHSVLLPEAVKEWKKDPRYIYEMKMDGRRYLLQVRPNGAKHNFLTSRRISVTTGEFVEKQDSVPMVRDYKFNNHWHDDWKDTIFDGEWCGGKDSNEAATAMANGEGYYVVWDLIMFKGKDIRNESLNYRRKLMLRELMPAFPPWMEMVISDPDPEGIFQIVKEENLEGVVRKDLAEPYGEGWTKAKKVSHFDVVIWGYEETNSADWKSKGWIGALLMGQWERQKLYCKPAQDFSAKEAPRPGITRNYNRVTYKFRNVGRCSGMTNKQRDLISKNQTDFLGQVIEIECNLRFDSGLFRHPRYNRMHPEKNSIECVYEL